jgi:hypothetical protein
MSPLHLAQLIGLVCDKQGPKQLYWVMRCVVLLSFPTGNCHCLGQ